jgi:RNA polymerase sigma-70 factor (ECF subfamily)
VEPEERTDVERALAERLSTRDYSAAATLVLRSYGPEILGFLLARTRDEAAAEEAFAMFTEDLWRGLPRFEGRATVRVWAYTLARHAAVRLESSPGRRRKRNLPLDAAEELSRLEHRLRTETARFLETEFKDRISALRARLSEEERTLLVLRVDRDLDWLDVARVFAGGEPTPASLKADAARLRKRFQLVKAKIREMAEKDGLIDGS